MDSEQFVRQLHKAMGRQTQKQFAARLGISMATLSRLRSGARRPGWRVIQALLREFPHLPLEAWGLGQDDGELPRGMRSRRLK